MSKNNKLREKVKNIIDDVNVIKKQRDRKKIYIYILT